VAAGFTPRPGAFIQSLSPHLWWPCPAVGPCSLCFPSAAGSRLWNFWPPNADAFGSSGRGTLIPRTLANEAGVRGRGYFPGTRRPLQLFTEWLGEDEQQKVKLGGEKGQASTYIGPTRPCKARWFSPRSYPGGWTQATAFPCRRMWTQKVAFGMQVQAALLKFAFFHTALPAFGHLSPLRRGDAGCGLGQRHQLSRHSTLGTRGRLGAGLAAPAACGARSAPWRWAPHTAWVIGSPVPVPPPPAASRRGCPGLGSAVSQPSPSPIPSWGRSGRGTKLSIKLSLLTAVLAQIPPAPLGVSPGVRCHVPSRADSFFPSLPFIFQADPNKWDSRQGAGKAMWGRAERSAGALRGRGRKALVWRRQWITAASLGD